MKTLAITIGNNNYYEGEKLDNPINDAKALSEVFEMLGFDTVHKEDCSIQDCVEVLQELEDRLGDYDASIFYFAGHGFQFDGENYLASIECQVSNPNKYHCSKTCLTLSEILDILKKNSNKVNIVILDACRKSFERGSSAPFSPIKAPNGTLIAFSTSPDDGAKDGGFEGHSIYTGALLKYIGRERISVEELFKKVRKTVYNLSDGAQTSWEHTSLIGDFYFNTGKSVHPVKLNYDDSVVKDGYYIVKDGYSSLIMEIKSYNWHRQNPAIDEILSAPPASLDKNQQFILGRNLTQANGYAYSASNFFENLQHHLAPYFMEKENHLLNGILFEIYFNNKGEFRNENFKGYNIEKVFELRKNPEYQKSFEFLQNVLEPYADILFYIPNSQDDIIDVDVLATNEETKDFLGNEETYQVISSVNVQGKDITKTISRYGIHGQNKLGLKKALSNLMLAPESLVQINSNIEIHHLAFLPNEEDLNF